MLLCAHTHIDYIRKTLDDGSSLPYMCVCVLSCEIDIDVGRRWLLMFLALRS
jgi:hypothetical protein